MKTKDGERLLEDNVDKLLYDLILELDYDVWKDYFLEGYAEEPEELEEHYQKLRKTASKWMRDIK